jgi:putative Holliday junction resolvase
MTVLGLDVGNKRIGVAVSDESRLLATPNTTIIRTELSKDIDSILEVISQKLVKEIVVGFPLSLSGKVGIQARNVSLFIDSLSSYTSIPIKTVDERYSTVEAEKRLKEIGVNPSENRSRVDALAAAIILQSYLDSDSQFTPSYRC